MSSWTCAICGRAHERLRTGFEADPPCRALRVTEADSHAAPDGYIVDGADRDDTNDAVHPSQAEVANDGADNDCDPSTVVSMNLYDAFSATANPFGNWSLGCAESEDSAGFVSYTGYGEYDASVNYGESAGGEGARAYRNHTDSDWSCSSVTFPAMAVALHPGAAGEFSTIRWTAPVATTCAVDVVFSGQDDTTAVATSFAGVLLTGGELSGWGDTVPVMGTFPLRAGDTVDFTVGMNGTYYFDSTGLEGTLACECGGAAGGASTRVRRWWRAPTRRRRRGARRPQNRPLIATMPSFLPLPRDYVPIFWTHAGSAGPRARPARPHRHRSHEPTPTIMHPPSVRSR